MPQETVDRAICARFKEVRQFYARTQAEFAEKFDIPRSTVSDIEREALNPPKTLILKIIEKGDISPAWLMRGDGGMFRLQDQSESLRAEANAKEAVAYVLPRREIVEDEAAFLYQGVDDILGPRGLNGIERNRLRAVLSRLLQNGLSAEEILRFVQVFFDAARVAFVVEPAQGKRRAG